jgi:hypothetical protein
MACLLIEHNFSVMELLMNVYLQLIHGECNPFKGDVFPFQLSHLVQFPP